MTLAFFARHEIRMAWRDWLAILSAGRKRRRTGAAIALVLFAAGMHLLANAMVGRYAALELDKPAYVVITGSIGLAFSLMLSQAMESVTRAFYSRADFDLILSSPTSVRTLFAVRMAAVALAAMVLAALLSSPFINMLAWRGGVHWLGGYGVAMALGATATAIALFITTGLVRAIGPARTRLVAQVLAAVVGAALVIGIQVVGIMTSGTLSRFQALESDDVITALPDDADHPIWWPARALLGEPGPLAGLLVASLILLTVAIVLVSRRFAHQDVWAVRATPAAVAKARRPAIAFKSRSPGSALRRKEWALLVRDPWLASQTLMQLLYLLPPALLMWRNFGTRAGAAIVVTPVLVMAAGQLAGGLAWLAISGEDAPDLIATAPVTGGAVLRAKLEAILAVIGGLFAPFLLALAWTAPVSAAIAAAGIALSAASATAIQLWFRAQAKRTAFRRRHTSSRVPTFAEVFAALSWAGAAALAANGSRLALYPVVLAGLVLLGARLLRPRPV